MPFFPNHGGVRDLLLHLRRSQYEAAAVILYFGDAIGAVAVNAGSMRLMRMLDQAVEHVGDGRGGAGLGGIDLCFHHAPRDIYSAMYWWRRKDRHSQRGRWLLEGTDSGLVGNYVRGVVAITYNRIGPAAYQRGEVRGLPLTLGVFRDALRCLAPDSDARTVRWFKADAASVPALLPLPERPNNALSELFADDATDVATGVKAAPIAR